MSWILANRCSHWLLMSSLMLQHKHPEMGGGESEPAASVVLRWRPGGLRFRDCSSPELRHAWGGEDAWQVGRWVGDVGGWRNGGGGGGGGVVRGRGKKVPSVVLTIRLGVAVDQRGHADEDLTAVALHHQLQLATRLLDQLPRVVQ